MKVEEHIDALKGAHPELVHRCMHGDCYRFAKFMQESHDGILVMNRLRNHVALKTESGIYDIRGKLPKKRECEFHEMSESEEKAASKWSFRCRNGNVPGESTFSL